MDINRSGKVMSDKAIVKELNAYLKGEYMGIHAFEHYIHHTQDPHIKTELQRMQQEHKQHAAKIAERIQNLGGQAVMDNGMKLSMMEFMMDIKGYPDTTEGILKGVIKGQMMGIDTSEEIVQGDLDQTSLLLVKENLAEDRAQVDQLMQLQ